MLRTKKTVGSLIRYLLYGGLFGLFGCAYGTICNLLAGLVDASRPAE